MEGDKQMKRPMLRTWILNHISRNIVCAKDVLGNLLDQAQSSHDVERIRCTKQ